MCVIFCPLDMKGLIGAATAMESLMYGAEHCWNGTVNMHLRGSSLAECPNDGQVLSNFDQIDVPGGTMAQRRHISHLILLCSVHRYYHRSPFSPSHLSVLCSQILSQISIFSTSHPSVPCSQILSQFPILSISSFCALFTDTITDFHFLLLTFLCSVHRYYHRSPFSPPHPFVLYSQILSQISIFSISPFCALFTDTITVLLPFSFLLP